MRATNRAGWAHYSQSPRKLLRIFGFPTIYTATLLLIKNIYGLRYKNIGKV